MLCFFSLTRYLLYYMNEKKKKYTCTNTHTHARLVHITDQLYGLFLFFTSNMFSSFHRFNVRTIGVSSPSRFIYIPPYIWFIVCFWLSHITHLSPSILLPPNPFPVFRMPQHQLTSTIILILSSLHSTYILHFTTSPFLLFYLFLPMSSITILVSRDSRKNIKHRNK